MSLFEQIDQENFEREVLHSETPVLVEFGAAWCGPCKRLEPEMEKLAAQWKQRIRLGKVDVDQNVDITLKYQVMSVPTVILFVNGEPRQRLSGFQPVSRLVERFEPHL
ncbi:MAG TPA: thioredoxin [Anaerolineaceae bacterium]|nr:thioredoxin [Anaerolineaceae bacterium]